MRCYTYHQSLPSISADYTLHALWKETWSRNGWEPVLLSRADILYENLGILREMEASSELGRGPTPDGYTRACCERWAVFLGREPAVFADMDVLCNGLRPEDLTPHIVGDLPLFLSANNCPCAVYATPTGVREMVDTILQHAREVDSGEYDPTAHPSELSFIAHDQAIFGRYNFRWHYPKSPLVCNYSPDNEEWRNYPLIHYPNDTTPKPRGETIRSLNLFP